MKKIAIFMLKEAILSHQSKKFVQKFFIYHIFIVSAATLELVSILYYYRILCGNWHIIACKNHTGITFTE